MSDNKYVFCSFSKGESHRRGWIPIEKAVLGARVQMKTLNSDPWEEDWYVLDVGDTELDSSYINERSQDYKHTRAASDV